MNPVGGSPSPSAGGLRVGLYLPTFTGSFSGRTPRWPDLLDLARTAEAAGLHSIWIADELLWRFEGEPTLGFWESWTLVSAIAAATSTIEIGTLVMCTNYRPPALLAKMAETADEVSGGRITLGLGAGWSADQFAAFGVESTHLVDRFEESLTVIRGLLHEGSVSFDGRYHRVADCEIEPRGPRPGRIPILVGASRPRMISLAARDADAWNGFLVGRSFATEIPPLRAALDAACAEVGRDPATLGRSAAVVVAYGDDPVMVGPSDWTERAIRGSPEEIADQMAAFAREGIDHLQVAVLPTTSANVDRFLKSLEILSCAPTGTRSSTST